MRNGTLSKLRLNKYRCFESYVLENLTRVNLLVGKNNCGKTSVLEAINLLIANGSPLVIEELAIMRDERRIQVLESPYRQVDIVDISPLFSGHNVPIGEKVVISSNQSGVSLQIVPDSEVEDYFYDDSDIKRMAIEHAEIPAVGLKITTEPLTVPIPVLPLGETGSLIYSNRLRRRSQVTPTRPCQFLTPTSLHPRDMHTLWNKAVREGGEAAVIRALQFLQGNIESIHFLMDNRFAPDVLVGVRGGGRKLPLSSFGDGMRRLLALTLSLTESANGVLLIDEIDSGLHWTVMEDLWRLVIDTARKADIQVFATTHSLDCIRGLAALVGSEKDLASDVSIQKIERSLKKAVVFDGTDVLDAIRHNIEVR